MSGTTIAGILRWIPVADNGPTMPFEHERISAFAYVGDDQRRETVLVAHGVRPGATESEVEARWVNGYPELPVRPGDLITLTASQRPIAILEVTAAD